LRDLVMVVFDVAVAEISRSCFSTAPGFAHAEGPEFLRGPFG
jgi:hypothetical protein